MSADPSTAAISPRTIGPSGPSGLASTSGSSGPASTAAAAVGSSSASAVGSSSGSAAPRRAARRSASGRSTLVLVLNVVTIVLGLAVWWLLSLTGLQIPSPFEVLAAGVELARKGVLLEDVVASLRRVLIGFVLGSALAIPVGFLMGWYSWARGLLEPWVQFFRTIPPLAIIPLAIVLMGIGEQPKIFVIFLGAFLSCVISTFQGVVQVDRTLINAARVLGAKDATIFARVVVPASTPFILVGMRVGLGAAWATVVAAELIAAQQGLGYRMQQAQIYYDLPTIFVGILIIGIFGLVMDRTLLVIEKRLTSWQERR
ncbi:ABC transporter permease [Brachybacterium sp. DNPG3]